MGASLLAQNVDLSVWTRQVIGSRHWTRLSFTVTTIGSSAIPVNQIRP